MDSTAWAGLFALLGTVAGLVFTAYKFRATRRDDEGRTSYDQIQEDLAALRADFLKEKEERRVQWESDQRQIRYQGSIIRHLDDEIIALREGIQTGKIPPLPPRNPWPAYPGEWQEIRG